MGMGAAEHLAMQKPRQLNIGSKDRSTGYFIYGVVAGRLRSDNRKLFDPICPDIRLDILARLFYG